ncbi:chemotaxis-specific protein-glutamate methyltransferase CheB [Natronolimnohabitans sp. A-GB9]|uniref:chemotaxis-specific protein-glutamate methyltransferase CheB n=1 Tax=Natronolimnohabitans sp. A-GB9 TaxID=3069757 RepID=UPI0027B01B1D|nr:chemotaxis-specific protein-glutamate methyltransferase CheB [Natronolimnohabitans sp. A-GB9]MDQ2051384.1 chemotaxis-specific protein-glutamate methyltransferase CheB [Natronolimnohabitans sp. A-GB9]
MTRVLVVDDSQFMRTVIGNALSEADYDVETATNGTEAIEAATTYDPDVVTMDVEMPELGGIDAVERIMATNPALILMLSVHTEDGAEATLDALERGAVDFLHKPDGSDSRTVADLSNEVVEKVDELADANSSSIALARAAASVHATRTTTSDVTDRAVAGGETGPEPAVGSGGPGGTRTRQGGSGSDVGIDLEIDETADHAGARPAAEFDLGDIELESEDAIAPTVVIGASTGGPKIVEELFERLPIGLDATVLVVQHMPAEFTDRFAKRLDARSEYDVREATDGESVVPGEAVVAPGDSHLAVDDDDGGRLRVRLDDSDRIHGVRPAIDVTMETAAEQVDGPLCGVVLTGMGRDGAAGIEAISAAGGHTIAQDEATSPVFGIPCQAIETGCVDVVAPATGLVEAIVDAFDTDGETDD